MAKLVSQQVDGLTAALGDTQAIQNNGCLLRFDAAMLKVRQVSANLSDFLGILPEDALLSSPKDLLGSILLSRLTDLLKNRESLSAALVINRQVQGHYQRFYVMAYRSSDDIIVEFEPLSRAGEQRLLPLVNEWLSYLADANDIASLLQTLTQGVQAITGFDRVVLNEFDSDANMTVVAETCKQAEPRLLGYRLPAYVIPDWVRERYGKNAVRSVPNIDAPSVPLIPAISEDLPKLDMTYGYLRRISSMHKDNLSEIDVKATLSIAIHSHRAFWGIVVCHSFAEQELSPLQRDAAVNLVRMASQRLFLLQHIKDASFLQDVMDSRELLSSDRTINSKPNELFISHVDSWLKLFDLCGFALSYNNKVTCFSETLAAYEIEIITKWLTHNFPDDVIWVSSQLNQTELNDLVDLRNRVGLMAVRLPSESAKKGWMLMFRKAQRQEQKWLGHFDDLKKICSGELRKSDDMPREVCIETINDRSAEWLKIEKKAALELAEDLMVALSVNEINLLNKNLNAANVRLQEIAHTDSLTQVWNRYRVEQAMDAELSAAARYQRPFSVLLFDVDHFKQVNDKFGHKTGDEVLKRLATEVHSLLRGSDFLGRWGGEEFIVLVSNSVLTEAGELADRLRKHIAKVQFAEVGQVTISIGVAQWQTGESRRALVERADKAMYGAKQNGRNCVELAD